MNCVSCGIEVSPSFKHAFSQNICPACGGALIDEESLALIEDVGATLSSEAPLRAETANKLAVALVARYDIQLRTGHPVQRPAAPAVAKPAVQQKQAQPSIAQQLMKERAEPNIVTAEELMKTAQDGGISEAEREAIMADVVSNRYGMVDQLAANEAQEGEIEEAEFGELGGNIFPDSQEVPILEKERLLRLQKQQQAMQGGGGSFRRSS